MADLFEEVVLLEEAFVRRGREEAFSDAHGDSHSLQASFAEGQAVGLARGFEVGYELGVMAATCSHVMATSSSKKLQDKCASLLQKIEAMPMHNDVNVDMHNLLNELRGSYRAILSLAGMPTAQQPSKAAETELF